MNTYPIFSKFIDRCKELMPQEHDLLRLIIKRYNDSAECRFSEEMLHILQTTNASIERDPKHIFIHLQSFLNNLKRLQGLPLTETNPALLQRIVREQGQKRTSEERSDDETSKKPRMEPRTSPSVQGENVSRVVDPPKPSSVSASPNGTARSSQECIVLSDSDNDGEPVTSAGAAGPGDASRVSGKPAQRNGGFLPESTSQIRGAAPQVGLVGVGAVPQSNLSQNLAQQPPYRVTASSWHLPQTPLRSAVPGDAMKPAHFQYYNSLPQPVSAQNFGSGVHSGSCQPGGNGMLYSHPSSSHISPSASSMYSWVPNVPCTSGSLLAQTSETVTNAGDRSSTQRGAGKLSSTDVICIDSDSDNEGVTMGKGSQNSQNSSSLELGYGFLPYKPLADVHPATDAEQENKAGYKLGRDMNLDELMQSSRKQIESLGDSLAPTVSTSFDSAGWVPMNVKSEAMVGAADENRLSPLPEILPPKPRTAATPDAAAVCSGTASAATSTAGQDNETEEPKPGPSHYAEGKQKEASARHIHRLEVLLKKLKKEIQRCEREELDFNDMDAADSIYIYQDKLEKKFVKVWNKLCELTERATATGRATEKKYICKASRYDVINRKVERYINRKKEFPDFTDIRRLVNKISIREGLNFSMKKVKEIATAIFTDIGETLQKRRKEDLAYNMGYYLENPDAQDPAARDTELKQQLDSSKAEGRTRMEEVYSKYSQLQEDSGAQPEEVGEDTNLSEAEEETADDEDDGLELEDLDSALDEDSNLPELRNPTTAKMTKPSTVTSLALEDDSSHGSKLDQGKLSTPSTPSAAPEREDVPEPAPQQEVAGAAPAASEAEDDGCEVTSEDTSGWKSSSPAPKENQDEAQDAFALKPEAESNDAVMMIEAYCSVEEEDVGSKPPSSTEQEQEKEEKKPEDSPNTCSMGEEVNCQDSVAVEAETILEEQEQSKLAGSDAEAATQSVSPVGGEEERGVDSCESNAGVSEMVGESLQEVDTTPASPPTVEEDVMGQAEPHPSGRVEVPTDSEPADAAETHLSTLPAVESSMKESLSPEHDDFVAEKDHSTNDEEGQAEECGVAADVEDASEIRDEDNVVDNASSHSLSAPPEATLGESAESELDGGKSADDEKFLEEAMEVEAPDSLVGDNKTLTEPALGDGSTECPTSPSTSLESRLLQPEEMSVVSNGENSENALSISDDAVSSFDASAAASVKTPSIDEVVEEADRDGSSAVVDGERLEEESVDVKEEERDVTSDNGDLNMDCDPSDNDAQMSAKVDLPSHPESVPTEDRQSPSLMPDELPLEMEVEDETGTVDAEGGSKVTDDVCVVNDSENADVPDDEGRTDSLVLQSPKTQEDEPSGREEKDDSQDRADDDCEITNASASENADESSPQSATPRHKLLVTNGAKQLFRTLVTKSSVGIDSRDETQGDSGGEGPGTRVLNQSSDSSKTAGEDSSKLVNSHKPNGFTSTVPALGKEATGVGSPTASSAKQLPNSTSSPGQSSDPQKRTPQSKKSYDNDLILIDSDSEPEEEEKKKKKADSDDDVQFVKAAPAVVPRKMPTPLMTSTPRAAPISRPLPHTQMQAGVPRFQGQGGNLAPSLGMPRLSIPPGMPTLHPAPARALPPRPRMAAAPRPVSSSPGGQFPVYGGQKLSLPAGNSSKPFQAQVNRAARIEAGGSVSTQMNRGVRMLAGGSVQMFPGGSGSLGTARCPPGTMMAPLGGLPGAGNVRSVDPFPPVHAKPMALPLQAQTGVGRVQGIGNMNRALQLQRPQRSNEVLPAQMQRSQPTQAGRGIVGHAGTLPRPSYRQQVPMNSSLRPQETPRQNPRPFVATGQMAGRPQVGVPPLPHSGSAVNGFRGNVVVGAPKPAGAQQPQSVRGSSQSRPPATGQAPRRNASNVGADDVIVLD